MLAEETIPPELPNADPDEFGDALDSVVA